jgi:hypothetical protein
VCPPTAQHRDGSPGGGAGGQPVVDDDDGAALNRLGGPAPTVAGHPPCRLGPFGPDDVGEVFGGQADAGDGDQGRVEHHDAHFSDGAQGQLGLPGAAELADDQDIQGRAERPGHLGGHRHPTAGQASHDRRLQPELVESPGQLAARIGPIPNRISTHPFAGT